MHGAGLPNFAAQWRAAQSACMHAGRNRRVRWS
jgi:hypothetical protein